MQGILLLLHVLGAAIWTGGHLILCLCILPDVIRKQDIDSLLCFEQKFEKLGIPALLIQVTSGLALAWLYVPDMGDWVDFSRPMAMVISFKLMLLALTLILALDARLRILPKLNRHNLGALVWHIVPVTVISVLFVVLGVSVRTSWW